MLEANTGKILWSFDTHASIISAPVMTNDALYVGATFTHNTGKLYKFTTQEHLQINNLQHNQQHSLINHISEQKETNGNSDSHGDSHSGEGSWSESGSGSWSGGGGGGGQGSGGGYGYGGGSGQGSSNGYGGDYSRYSGNYGGNSSRNGAYGGNPKDYKHGHDSKDNYGNSGSMPGNDNTVNKQQ